MSEIQSIKGTPNGIVIDVHMSIEEAQQCFKATEMQMWVGDNCHGAGVAMGEPQWNATAQSAALEPSKAAQGAIR